MGKHKTQRTDRLIGAAKRLLLAEQIENTIEQHNFDKLVAQGTIVEGGSRKGKAPQGGGTANVIVSPAM